MNILKLLIVLFIAISCAKKSSKNTFEDKASIDANKTFFELPGDIKALNSSDHKNLLEDCPYKYDESSCNFLELSLLKEKADYGVQDILDRVVTNLPWTRKRFADYLNANPSEELLYLFGSVRGIVISSRLLSPGFYIAGTGFIYINASYFVSTQEEADSLPEIDDYRAGRAVSIDVSRYSLYSIGNSLLKDYNVVSRLQINYLMYHELMHANDFYPRSFVFDFSKSANEIAFERQSKKGALSLNLVNERLPSPYLTEYEEYVNSGSRLELFSIEEFNGAKMFEKLMESNAVRTYGYSSRAEYFATLLDEFLLFKNHGISVNNLYLRDEYDISGQLVSTMIDGGVQNKFFDEKVVPGIKEAYSLVFNKELDFNFDDHSQRVFKTERTLESLMNFSETAFLESAYEE